MSLVNQMLRDLELRQGGQLAADGGVLGDIGAVREPLPVSGPGGGWRGPVAALWIGTGAALLAIAATWQAPPWSWPEASKTATEGSQGFLSVVRPAPSPAGSASRDRHPPSPASSGHDAGAKLAEAVPAPARAAWAGLRLARELVVPVTVANVSPPVVAASAKTGVPAPGKASLPADLGAVAARFDREFAASLDNADAPLVAPRPVPASAPMRVKTATRTGPAEQADALYAAAATAAAGGARAEAETGLQAALLAHPAHADARRLLATLWLQSGRFDAAERLLAEAPQSTPALAALRARVLVELGRDAEALAVLEPFMGRPADLNQVALHAALMQRLGDHAGASAAYRQVVAAQPGNGVWWMGLGISLEALGLIEETRDAYRRARSSGQLDTALLDFVETRLAAL